MSTFEHLMSTIMSTFLRLEKKKINARYSSIFSNAQDGCSFEKRSTKMKQNNGREQDKKKKKGKRAISVFKF